VLALETRTKKVVAAEVKFAGDQRGLGQGFGAAAIFIAFSKEKQRTFGMFWCKLLLKNYFK